MNVTRRTVVPVVPWSIYTPTYELRMVLSWITLVTHAGFEPHVGSAHSQLTPVDTLVPMLMRWNVEPVVKCSM